MKLTSIKILFVVFIFGSCNQGIESAQGEWSIPFNKVLIGAPKDAIPALTEPGFISASEVTYLDDDDLVVGYKGRAYPHKILDWHEIVNDSNDGSDFAVTYCPLTGTATTWNRLVDGEKTTFGVSGFLYNSNLIPYDRATGSNYSQMLLKGVNGDEIEMDVETLQSVETTWKTWKAMYPNSQVVSTNTGFSRNYQSYPYGNYKTTNNTIFPIDKTDDRLFSKDRVLGAIVDGEAVAFQFKDIEDNDGVLYYDFMGKEMVVIGDETQNYMVAFAPRLNGELLTFTKAASVGQGIMIDQNDNVWNVFGRAISGPHEGAQLETIESFIGFWFAWATFYPGIELLP